MLARFEGPERPLEVQAIGQRNIDAVNLRIIKNVLGREVGILLAIPYIKLAWPMEPTRRTLVGCFHFSDAMLVRIGLGFAAVPGGYSVYHNIRVCLCWSYKSIWRDVCGAKDTEPERLSGLGDYCRGVLNLPIALGETKETCHLISCLFVKLCWVYQLVTSYFVYLVIPEMKRSLELGTTDSGFRHRAWTWLHGY